MISNKKLSDKEMANQKAERILEGIGYWAAYYRCNPQRFVKEYLNINLKRFQKFLIYAMMHNKYFMFWASRGLGGKNITFYLNT